MKQFNSKNGPELVIPIALLLTYLLYEAIIDFSWSALIITMLTIVFFGYLFLSIKYFITGKTLAVKWDVFIDERIDISKITAIREVTDFFAAPATSIYRLE